MKYLYTLIFILFWGTLHAQPFITFEAGDTAIANYLSIDTTHYPHNNWQIGKPQKSVFDSAFWSNRAIITDTLNPYSTGDTSAFVVKVPMTWWGPWGANYLGQIYFRYKIDIDTDATAMVEISEDLGATWHDTRDTLPSLNYGPGTTAPILIGSGWQTFDLFRYWWSPRLSDSLILRFTFIAGSNTAAKDGWMIDNIQIVYMMEGVDSLNGPCNDFSLFPNPSSDLVTITMADKAYNTATLINSVGQVVLQQHLNSNISQLNISTLPAGVYHLALKGTAGNKTLRLVKM